MASSAGALTRHLLQGSLSVSILLQGQWGPLVAPADTCFQLWHAHDYSHC